MGKLQRSHIEVVIHLWMDSKQKAFSPSLHGYIYMYVSVQFSSVAQSCLTLRLHESQHARPPCLSPTPGVYSNSMSTESVMPSSRLILCRPLLLLPSIFPSIRVFSNESGLRIRWPKYWSFGFSISPSNEHPGLISFRMDLVQSKKSWAGVLTNTKKAKSSGWGRINRTSKCWERGEESISLAVTRSLLLLRA